MRKITVVQNVYHNTKKSYSEEEVLDLLATQYFETAHSVYNEKVYYPRTFEAKRVKAKEFLSKMEQNKGKLL